MSSRLVLEMLELVIGSDDVFKQSWFRYVPPRPREPR